MSNISERTRIIQLYRALTPEDKAIVDRIIVKIQMSKNEKAIRIVRVEPASKKEDGE